MTSSFGNPHSSSHEYGWETEDAVTAARRHIANLINADEKEIVFTSGATESNNQALKVGVYVLLGLGQFLWSQ